MTSVDFARWQFAFTSISHFLFISGHDRRRRGSRQGTDPRSAAIWVRQ
jgi:hypothetical protein